MALTPEDVVNKRFQSTKFREGYDQDEVDDFLDEIVVELRRLTQENDELRQRLVAADARIAELQRGGGAQQPAMAPPAPSIPAPAPAPAPTPMVAPMSAGTEDSENTNNLLQLARRLHEEHVREGMAKRDEIIAEGQAEAARIVRDAQSSQAVQLQSLEQERVALEQRVEELRVFEREYRAQLRTYIQSQLQELEGSSGQQVAAPAQQPVPQPASPAMLSSAAVGSAPGFSESGQQPSYNQFPGSAPSYQAPQSSPPGQFPGYGS